MPTRMIREGLLDSDRYWSVTIEARQLYWHLLLLADDFGCVSLAPAFLRRRCFDDGPAGDKIDRLVQQLLDADLVRIYECHGGRYGFIPRFGQRLRLNKLKHPEPPAALLEGDDDAKAKFQEFKGKGGNLLDTRPTSAAHVPDTRRPEVEVKGIETEGKGNAKGKGEANRAPPRNFVPKPRWWDTEQGVLETASQLGVEPRPGESTSQFKGRVFAAIEAKNKQRAAH